MVSLADDMGLSTSQICRKQLICEGEPTGPYSEVLRALLERQAPNLEFIEQHPWTISEMTFSSPWERVHEGEHFLSAALVIYLAKEKIQAFPNFSRAVELFRGKAVWPELSLVTAQIQLLKLLVEPEEVESCPDASRHFRLINGHYWSWADAPFVFHHLHLGIVYGLIAFLSDDISYANAAKAIADWQMQLLDCDGAPTTLYQREGQASKTELLALHALLFQITARLHQCSKSSYYSEILMQMLKDQGDISRLSPYFSLVEIFLQRQQAAPAPVETALSTTVADPMALLTGFRTPQRTVLCTVTGSRTGLGYFREGDVTIVSYGPQALPLGECQQYGIEAPAVPGKGTIEMSDSVFRIHNTVKLPLEPPVNSHPASFGILPPPYDYAEVTQEYHDKMLSLVFKPYRWKPQGDLAFTFFIKAEKCLLEDGSVISPRSLELYKGTSKSVRFSTGQSHLTLQSPGNTGEMQIIPLSGVDVFWGADYLISYKTPSKGGFYQWKILSI